VSQVFANRATTNLRKARTLTPESAETLAATPVASFDSRVAPAKRKKKRPPIDLGRKVSRWLADQKADRLEPSSVSALAERVGVSEGTIRAWVQDGRRPNSETLQALCSVMGVDPAWLSDNTKPYETKNDADSLDAVIRLMPSDLKKRLLPVLRDPREREGWIRSYEARHGR
jgi:transcriptional regulator with XRE-family HTH domain